MNAPVTPGLFGFSAGARAIIARVGTNEARHAAELRYHLLDGRQDIAGGEMLLTVNVPAAHQGSPEAAVEWAEQKFREELFVAHGTKLGIYDIPASEGKQVLVRLPKEACLQYRAMMDDLDKAELDVVADAQRER